jgi:hypothetical protein
MVEKRLIICFLLYSGIICIAIKYEKKYFWDLFFGRKFYHLAIVTPSRDDYLDIYYADTLSWLMLNLDLQDYTHRSCRGESRAAWYRVHREHTV